MPATKPAFHAGKAPRNKGQRYPADSPTVDEIVVVMRRARQARYGARLNGLIVVLWRRGLRIHEALSLLESDLWLGLTPHPRLLDATPTPTLTLRPAVPPDVQNLTLSLSSIGR